MSKDNLNQEEFKRAEEEAAKKLAEQQSSSEEIEVKDVEEVEAETEQESSVIDGYRQIEKDKLPFGGKLYPESWAFYYRCPTTKEVANFSTIDENNQPAIIKGVTSLITKCFTIVDNETQKTIPSEQINDGERLFFFLKLREFYLNDAPIEYNIVDENDEDGILKINFFAESLVFDELKSGLIKKFDGRTFTFEVDGTPETQIKFLIPTLKTTTRIIKYMENLHKKVADTNKDGITKEEFNKQFMLFAPFLYETGSESVMSLRKKFINLQKNEVKYRYFNNIINNLTVLLTNKETIKYIVDDNEGDCLMKFPGGWKHMFMDNSKFSDIF